MKKLIQSLAIAGLFVAVSFAAQGQTNKVTFTLTIEEQTASSDDGINSINAVKKGSLTTKTLLAALALDAGTTFATGSYLAYDNGSEGFVVVDKSGNETDVSSILSLSVNNSVSQSKFSDADGSGSETDWNTVEFDYSGGISGLNFTITGQSVSQTTVSKPNKNELVKTTQSSSVSSLVGTGTLPDGNPIFITGTATEAAASLTQ